MSILAQNCDDNHEIESSMTRFFKDYKLGQLLHLCRADKQKGIPVMNVFTYLFCLIFSGRSMYMQLRTGKFQESFSKNTVYRFLNSAKTNWLRFTTLLSERVVNEFLRDLTSDEREDVFIIDDTMFNRTGYKKTELISKVFDHVTMRYKKGFRLLTLGWSDGNTFVPINFSLLASSKDENILGTMKECDKRSLAGRRRKMARSKANDVMIDLLKAAQTAGHKAKYVLFDTWFSTPKEICRIKKECNLDVIAMIKKSSRIHYRYNGQCKDIKQIFAANKKRKGRSKYLLSVEVEIIDKNQPDNVPARIVFVRNRSNRKDWIALICTNPNLPETEIIRIYGKRWDTEVFYKTCKSWLNLGSECHSLSYDAMTAHVALVFARYMFLATQQRQNTDERSICELFYVLCDEIKDITFGRSFRLLVEALLESIAEIFHATDEQLQRLMDNFFNRLPKYLQQSLRCSAAM